jgi:uncharacterized protein YuzE
MQEGEKLMDYKYDPESNVLSITISQRPYDYAEEMGDFIVHFDKQNKPVYIEILNANKFLKNAVHILPKETQKGITGSIST